MIFSKRFIYTLCNLLISKKDTINSMVTRKLIEMLSIILKIIPKNFIINAVRTAPMLVTIALDNEDIFKLLIDLFVLKNKEHSILFLSCSLFIEESV